MFRSKKEGFRKSGTKKEGRPGNLKGDDPFTQSKKGGLGTYSGRISVTAKGIGYVEVPGYQEDVEIANQHMNTALQGDEVEITLLPKIPGRRQGGRVRKIISRARTRFVATIFREGETALAIPDERKFYTQIELPPNTLIPTGEKVWVEMTWRNPYVRPQGVVLKSLGKKGEHEVEMRSILLEKGFEGSFQEAIENEAGEIKKGSLTDFAAEVARREDFREVPTMTIDPIDAKDFDDALSLRVLKNGEVEVGVHIADVSHYVRVGTKLDEEARKRGTSVYLVDRTIPMLPEALSNDLCSLNPNENKLTFSVIFTLSPSGKILEKRIHRTIIRSVKRFSYEEAQKVLDKGSGELYLELKILRDFAKKFEEERFQKGAIAFEDEEVKFELDDRGKPIRVFKKRRLETHKLIEEWMLLANKAAAEYVNSLGRNKQTPPFIYRVHDTPDRDKIAALALFLKAIGRELPTKGGKVSGQDINALFKHLEGEAEEGIVKTAALRSMAKAIYSTRNIGHFGLQFEHYTHFTSPIRRYPDTVVHRLLNSYLSGKKVSEKDINLYEKICRDSTEAEIRATEAERESVKLKQVEWMEKRIGQEFEGIISGVTDWGIYVEEKETKCEGMARLKDMDDYYLLDEKNYRLVGEKTEKTYALGDRVRFRVVGADIERKTLDYKIL